MSTYYQSLLPFIAIDILLAMSLNLLMGYSGLMSVSAGGSMGVGAYCAAVLATRYGFGMNWTIVAGAVAAALVGFVFIWATERLPTDEFILVSFAFQMVLVNVFSRWSAVTKGNIGLPGIPRPGIFGHTATTPADLAIVAIIICAIGSLYIAYIGRSRWALSLRAIRESERAAQATGKNVSRIKIVAFAISSGLAGLAGGVYAGIIGIITPANFDITESILIIAFLLVGGIGNMSGVALGALTLYLFPELIQHYGVVPAQYVGPAQQIIYGSVIALFVLLRPVGILPERPLFRVKPRRFGVANWRRVGPKPAANQGAGR